MNITIKQPLQFVRMSPAHPLKHARDTRTEASADDTTICRQCLAQLRRYRPGRLAVFERKPDTSTYRSF